VPFDVRIIAATNRDLEADVAEHRFREDLYYRVNVVRVDVPPLRARGADVLLLARHFIEHFAAAGGAPGSTPVQELSGPAAQRLLAYDWPGNVRELQNCVERALAVSRFDQIGVDDLPLKIRDHVTSSLIVPLEDPRELPSMAEVEYRYIRKVLHAVGGNKTLAAKVLAFDRRTLYRKLERAS
jgi:two-component system response regulator HydG